jgi:hypothetical protein
MITTLVTDCVFIPQYAYTYIYLMIMIVVTWFAIRELVEQGRVAPLSFSALPHCFRLTLCPYFPESESSSAKEFDSNAKASDSYSDVPCSNVDGTLTLW